MLDGNAPLTQEMRRAILLPSVLLHVGERKCGEVYAVDTNVRLRIVENRVCRTDKSLLANIRLLGLWCMTIHQHWRGNVLLIQ